MSVNARNAYADGEPDIVFWKHNGDSTEKVIENIGKYPAYDLSVVPYFDSYDEAKTIVTD